MARDQLMTCHKAIMAVKITSPNDRPLLDIKYPKGYEGGSVGFQEGGFGCPLVICIQYELGGIDLETE